MSLRALACLALLAGLVGCKHEAARSGDVLVPTPPSNSWLATQQTAGTLPSPLDGWVLSGGGPAIGSPCGSDGGGFSQAAGRFQEDTCGISRRVSVEHRSTALGFEESIPCEWRLPPGQASMDAFCVSGDHLAMRSRCLRCRLQNAGDVFHAKLSDLTPSQHAWLAGKVGLTSGTGPASADAWRGLAVASPRSPAQ